MDACDLVVIGLGSAGALAAALAAERGMKVIGLDSRPLGEAGARWVNGVAGWQFDAAGVERPRPPELRGERVPMHLVAGWGPTRSVVRDHELLEVDMRLLVARLQDRARAAGAELRQSKALGWSDGVLETEHGPLRPRFLADASGLGGLGILPVARPRPEEICVAAQEVRQVRDRQAAERFFQQHEIPLGETLCFTCVAGGYSIVNLRLDGDEVSLLTGSIPALGKPSGRQLLDRFVSEQPWVGERLFGGARPIPLVAPPGRLGAGQVALLGDAAGQVYGMHGSGVGAGMVAARTLIDALAGGGTPEDYNYQWQRAHGGSLAGAAMFCRFSSSLTPEHTAQMMSSGLMSPGLSRKGLDQRLLFPDLEELPLLTRGLLTSPKVALAMAPMVSRLGALYALYQTFPRDPAKIPAFEARARRLVGEF